MIFGHNYFDVLTSRFGGASNIWNRQGLSNVNSMSKTSRALGSSRTTGVGNSYYGLSANTIKAMNNAFNTTVNKSYMADTSVADGRYGSNSLLGSYGGYSSLLSSMFSSWF